MLHCVDKLPNDASKLVQACKHLLTIVNDRRVVRRRSCRGQHCLRLLKLLGLLELLGLLRLLKWLRSKLLRSRRLGWLQLARHRGYGLN